MNRTPSTRLSKVGVRGVFLGKVVCDLACSVSGDVLADGLESYS